MGQIDKIKKLEKLQIDTRELLENYESMFPDSKVSVQLTRMFNSLHEETVLAILDYPFACPHCGELDGYRETAIADIHSEFNEFHILQQESREFITHTPHFQCHACEEQIEWEVISVHKTKLAWARDEHKKIIKPRPFWRIYRGNNH